MIDGQFIKRLIKLQAANMPRQKVRNLIDIYEDNWDRLIEARLKAKYPNTYKSLIPKITKEFNLHKRIVDEIVNGGAYCEEVTRKAMVSDTTEDKRYQDAIKPLSLDSIMEHAHRYMLASRAILLQVAWEKNEPTILKHYFDNAAVYMYRGRMVAVEYYADIILPQDYDGLNEYWMEAQHYDYTYRFLYTLETDDAGKNRVLFTTYKKTRLDEVEESVQELPYRDETGNAVFPFILITPEETSIGPLNFTKGDYIIDGTLAITDRIIHLDHLADEQSWIQVILNLPKGQDIPGTVRKVVDGVEQVTYPKMIWSPDTISVAELNEQGHGGYQTMNIDVPQLEKWQFIKERATTLLSNEGISPDNFSLSATPSSGFALQISNRALNERRRRDIKRFRRFETEIFKVFRAIWNYHRPSATIDVKALFSVDYPNRDGIYSVQEETMREQHEIEYGIDHPIRILARRKNITIDQAEKLYAENLAWKQKYEPRVSLVAPGQDAADTTGE